jgi:hypothetical protein
LRKASAIFSGVRLDREGRRMCAPSSNAPLNRIERATKHRGIRFANAEAAITDMNHKEAERTLAEPLIGLCNPGFNSKNGGITDHH